MAEAVTAAQTSVVIPAFNEGASIATVVRDLTSAARWLEILVVDDGSSDQTGANAAAAGARVIRHPYNKGNGAAVKSGIRQAAGVFILIADADGQHRPADATRLVAQLDTYDLVVGARSGQTQASLARRLGNAVLNRIASYLTEQPIPGSDVRVSSRAARVPARVHPSAAQRLLDADDDDARVHAGGLQRALRAGRSGAACGRVEDPPRRRRRSTSF